MQCATWPACQVMMYFPDGRDYPGAGGRAARAQGATRWRHHWRCCGARSRGLLAAAYHLAASVAPNRMQPACAASSLGWPGGMSSCTRGATPPAAPPKEHGAGGAPLPAGQPVVLFKGSSAEELDVADANINLNAVLYRKRAVPVDGGRSLSGGAIAGGPCGNAGGPGWRLSAAAVVPVQGSLVAAKAGPVVGC